MIGKGDFYKVIFTRYFLFDKGQNLVIFTRLLNKARTSPYPPCQVTVRSGITEEIHVKPLKNNVRVRIYLALLTEYRFVLVTTWF